MDENRIPKKARWTIPHDYYTILTKWKQQKSPGMIGSEASLRKEVTTKWTTTTSYRQVPHRRKHVKQEVIH